ncbi:SubName: Full=Related to PHO80-cyclin {ECO:0000313/EMBL:CCA69568.1} [Serendipita indica DSM 11827]|uniref:Related to PHO80-cyclin n=1 Tax=Serendipita indica (strain DSM 11827) TaxID=1109443 RepID=G4TE21_SERID|nr:SubName: Full=Related to PHO80-cyclin {ECO:0000313/EMBL:CCA69568.1} [Serendipita indica DSM 11827]CCA69568.1 related to PHO80-cyclin [Serendipita indica DSM 11827]
MSATESVQTAGDASSRIELPGYFEDVQLDDLVVLIADLLQRMIVHNDHLPLSPEGLTRFHSRSTPAISVLDYLRRIVRYVRVERSVLLLMLRSIDQICARRPSFNISSLSVHRFIIASITILSKTFCDAFSPNPLFAKVGGVSLIELNLLEREFLSAMDWRLACTREVLHNYYVKLVRTHSSGRYFVPDTSPRPAPIDTLPSDQIEWNAHGASLSSSSSSLSTQRPQAGISASQAEEDDSSSDEEDSSPAMATDIRRRIPSQTSSNSNGTPLGNGNTSRIGHVPSSSATLEQNVAFMELRSLGNRTMASSPSHSQPSGSRNSPVNVPTATRSPLTTFRSPTVGRRRRRSSSRSEQPRVANALLDLQASDPGAVEGLLRGSRRRRLHLEDEDRRMEVEPGTPV